MEKSLLLATSDKAFSEGLSKLFADAGVKIQITEDPPSAEELESFLPDIFLFDIESIEEKQYLSYLEQISNRFPSIHVFIIAPPQYEEVRLFLALCAGSRGWLFKQELPFFFEELLGLFDKDLFIKPTVSQFILDEFKKIKTGEKLLPMEEEILRQSSFGLSLSDVQEHLKLSSKMLHSHWQNIWQKLTINAKAHGEVKVAQSQNSAESNVSTATLDEPKLVDEMLQLVTFRLAKEEFAVQIEKVQEIQRMIPITPLPRVESFVEGVVNLRGRIIPVIDLHKRLYLEMIPPTKHTRIVVVSVADKTVGMVVDSVLEVLRIASNKLEAPPSLLVNKNVEFIRSVVNLGERLILLLDLDKIVGE